MDKKKPGISRPGPDRIEEPMPAQIYPVIDTDLARDNLQNDLPAADLEDLFANLPAHALKLPRRKGWRSFPWVLY